MSADTPKLPEANSRPSLQLAAPEVPTISPDVVRDAIACLVGEEIEVLSPLLGPEFFVIVRAAPLEYAVLTFLAHFAIELPTISALSLGSDRHQSVRTETMRMLAMFGELYRALAPSLASASHVECEFARLRSTSWHGVALKYATEADKVIQPLLQSVPIAVKKVVATPEGKKHLHGLADCFRQPGHGVKAADARSAAIGSTTLLLVYSTLRSRGLAITDWDKRTLAMRLQQELPRAWAFQYGMGNTDFRKLGDADIHLLQSSVARSRPAYERDHLWLRWKTEDRMTPAPILDRWNSMSDHERIKVSPRKWQRVESDGGRKGAVDVVKSGLKNARSERDALGES